jgi:Leucine-rich repeat (LRR) protein
MNRNEDGQSSHLRPFPANTKSSYDTFAGQSSKAPPVEGSFEAALTGSSIGDPRRHSAIAHQPRYLSYRSLLASRVSEKHVSVSDGVPIAPTSGMRLKDDKDPLPNSISLAHVEAASGISAEAHSMSSDDSDADITSVQHDVLWKQLSKRLQRSFAGVEAPPLQSYGIDDDREAPSNSARQQSSSVYLSIVPSDHGLDASVEDGSVTSSMVLEAYHDLVPLSNAESSSSYGLFCLPKSNPIFEANHTRDSSSQARQAKAYIAEQRRKKFHRVSLWIALFAVLLLAIILAVTVFDDDVAKRGTTEDQDEAIPPDAIQLTRVPRPVSNETDATATPTHSPTLNNELTQTPVTTPILSLRQLILSTNITTSLSLLDEESPQVQAYRWLESMTTAGSRLDNSFRKYSNEKLLQRYALAVFYYSTEGAVWSNRQGWLSTDDECSWYSRSRDPVCDEVGRFVQLELSFNEVAGTLPSEIGVLTALTVFSITGGSSRRMSGFLPTEMSRLTALESFNVRGQGFGGTLPTDIFASWMRVVFFDATDNLFERVLPTDFGRLVSLSTLFLAGNRFTGTLPNELASLSALRTLSLGSNEFAGSIPTELGLLSDLEILSLEMNKLTALPSQLGSLQSLRRFTAYGNELQGTLHSILGNMRALQLLLLHSNQLSGTIPARFADLVSLETLDLSKNFLTGSVPSELGSMPSLVSLKLESNLLTGAVPEVLTNGHILQTIRFDSNNINLVSCPALVPSIYADCLPDSKTGIPELSCECCTNCCGDGGGCELVI